MATFTDPRADAAEAAEAVRGLAHALRADDQPDDIYDVLGELLLLTRRLTDVSGQLAAKLEHHRPLATDDRGNTAAGSAAVNDAVQRLAQAATHLDQAETSMNLASEAAARIAWQATPPASSATRYVGIVFLQGEEADRALGMIDLRGPESAIDHLTGYDVGSETVDAALENGYVYDIVPTGALDKTATRGGYTMIYNPDFGYVGLYRPTDLPADPDLAAPVTMPAHTPPALAGVASGETVAQRTRFELHPFDRHAASARAPMRGLSR